MRSFSRSVWRASSARSSPCVVPKRKALQKMGKVNLGERPPCIYRRLHQRIQKEGSLHHQGPSPPRTQPPPSLPLRKEAKENPEQDHQAEEQLLSVPQTFRLFNSRSALEPRHQSLCPWALSDRLVSTFSSQFRVHGFISGHRPFSVEFACSSHACLAFVQVLW